MFPGFGDVEHGFPDFHNFSLNSGKPLATILVTTQERCRMCGKALAVDPNTHIVVIYHEQRGSYLGSRVTKCCRTCKVYEHYCYWTQEGKCHFNDDCVSNEFLLSTEDIAFQNTLAFWLLGLCRLCLSRLSPRLSTEDSDISNEEVWLIAISGLYSVFLSAMFIRKMLLENNAFHG